MLQIPVKAAAVRNLTDARYFAAREVEWIGFTIEPENGNQVAEVRAMKEWLDGVQFMAEFSLQGADEIRQVAEYLEIDTVQVSHFTSVETVQELMGLQVHKTVIVSPEDTLATVLDHLEEYQGLVAAFQLDLTRVSNEQWPLQHVQRLAQEHALWIDRVWDPNTLLEWWG
ncbi:MAG: hypothetical protein AAGH79_16820, partial [Bacteroidota bacterium]